ncbi:MAG: MXAN_6640 family putative metalloprotease, partial [Gemmatimonadales bacterium]
DWKWLSTATRQAILDLRANGFGNLKETVETPHYVLHYTTQGNSAVPAQDADHNGIPDFIQLAATSWETVWNREVNQLGYASPKGTPQRKFHVYYRELPYYGYTVPENLTLEATSPVPAGTASAYIVVENDFYGFPRNDEDVTGQEPIRSGALKVTQAHEFMHALQFNINVYQSGWLFESHATWAEDQVYDGINDWHWYINRFLVNPDAPIFNRYVYGSAFFMNYLSETYGTDVTRQIWLAARASSTPDAVRLAGFGGSWEGMKAFGPAEYLLNISDFTVDPPSVIPNPRNVIRASYASYPVAVEVPPSSNKTPNRAPSGLGANFVDFLPGPSGTLTVSFDGADGYSWRAFAVMTPAKGQSGPPVLPLVLDGGSAGSIKITGFGTRWAKVTLVATIADRGGIEVPYAYGASVD